MISKGLTGFILAITVFVQFIAQVTATTSYCYTKSDSFSEGIENIEDYIKEADSDEPLVIFQFKKFPLMKEFSPSSESLPFLSNILGNEKTTKLENQEILHLDNSVLTYETFEILELPSSASVHLYDKHLNGLEVLLFDFQDSEYNLEKLDELLDSICTFLGTSSYTTENIVFNIGDEAENSSPFVITRSKTHKDHKNTKKPVDDDKLSDTWTEGLLMCLFVSLFLLVLLVVAISWVGSIDISYGALEKSTNPLKKTN